MNWTGGRLQRHSKKSGNAVITRQKQHFAKVRSRLQNGSSPQIVPFRASFLQNHDDALAGGVTLFGEGSTRHRGHSKGRQTTLHEYGSVLPVIQRLGAMKERSSRKSSVEVNQTREHRHAARGPYPVVLHRDPAEHVTRHKPVDDASHSLKKTDQKKRRRSDMSAEEELLEANRRRLLKQNDWVGLASSRPLHMGFASTGEKAKIGKRRKIDKGVNPRHPIGSRPVRTPAMFDGFTSHEPFANAVTVNGAEDISIRIGTDALFSQASVHRSHPEQTNLAVAKQSSETMLFDDENWASASVQKDSRTPYEVDMEPNEDSLYGVTPRTSPKKPYGIAGKATGRHIESPQEHNQDALSAELVVRPTSKECIVVGYPTRKGPHRDERRIPQTVESSTHRIQPPIREVIELSDDETSVEETSEDDEGYLGQTPEAPSEAPVDDEDMVGKPFRVYQGNLHATNEMPGSTERKRIQPGTTNSRLAFSSSSPTFTHPAKSEKRAQASAHNHEGKPGTTWRIARQGDEECGKTTDDGNLMRLLELGTDNSARSLNKALSRPALQRWAPPWENSMNSLHATLGQSASSYSQPGSRAPNTDPASLAQQSPSASLKRILSLEKKPFLHGPAVSDSDEVWRRFVFGDENSPEADQIEVSGSHQHEASQMQSVSSLAVGLPMSSALTVPLVSDELSRMAVSDSVPATENTHEFSGDGTFTSMHVNPSQSDAKSSSRHPSYVRQQSSDKGGAAVDSDSLRVQTSASDRMGHAAGPLSATDESIGMPDQRGPRREPPQSPRRLAFTKPPRYPVGSAKNRKLHIGRVVTRRIETKQKDKERRKDPLSVYDFPVSDEMDSMENIEDE